MPENILLRHTCQIRTAQQM